LEEILEKKKISSQVANLFNNRIETISNSQEVDKLLASQSSPEKKEVEKLEEDFIKVKKEGITLQEEKAELCPETVADVEILKLKREREMLDKRMREDAQRKNVVFYVKGEKEALQGSDMKRWKYTPSNVFDCTAEDIHFRICESQFHRFMSSVNYSPDQAAYSVGEVEYIVNPKVVKDFNQGKLDLSKKHDFLVESMKPVILFHGTTEQNMENILKTNFLIEKIGSKTDMGWYGKGFYFSEYPGLSMGYSGHSYLLVCLVYAGNAYKMANINTGCPLQQGYDSHISPDGSEVVIFNPKNILPCYKMLWRQHGTNNYAATGAFIW
jgi:hypothetical protein